MKKYDIVIVGGGPVGLAFAISLEKSNLAVLLIEKSPLIALEKPKDDGREIALTHSSVGILKNLGVWQLMDNNVISFIKEAQVFNANDKKPLKFSVNDNKLEALGYLVANYTIRSALFERARAVKNLTILSSVAVNDIVVNKTNNTLILDNGDSIAANLLVAADSRMSNMRSKMAISSQTQDFHKSMIVARVKHTKAHNNVALEWFKDDKTLALLPMVGNVSSMVLTLANNDVRAIMALTDNDFNKYISNEFAMGDMELIGIRYCYPLVGVLADNFIASRFALIGDAAVGMHPVTAHGFNLGLRGQNILSDEILKAHSVNMAVGNNFVLKQYYDKQALVSKVMYFGTNSVVAIFANDKKILKPIRKIALKLAQNFPPVHYLISKHLTQSGRANNSEN